MPFLVAMHSYCGHLNVAGFCMYLAGLQNRQHSDVRSSNDGGCHLSRNIINKRGQIMVQRENMLTNNESLSLMDICEIGHSTLNHKVMSDFQCKED